MDNLTDIFRTLGDETRLRILRLLAEESLNVGELTRILGVAQPTVSKHLRELRKAELVSANRRNGFHYYQLAAGRPDLWSFLSPLLKERTSKGDRARLIEILRQREEYSEADRFVVPGRSWVVWSRALGYLLPAVRVADFGCGDGAFTVEMARWAEKVFAIDSNRASLELARSAASHLPNVTFLQRRMEDSGLADSSVDLVVVSQSLHYVDHPTAVFSEAYRVLRPGGRLLLIELLPHAEEWVTSQLNHRWLGFKLADIEAWLKKARFVDVQVDSEFKRRQQPVQPFVAAARRRKEAA